MENTNDKTRLEELQQEYKILKEIVKTQKSTIDRLVNNFISNKDSNVKA